MKTFLRTAAVVAFFCFFSAGVVLLQAGSGSLEDRIFPLVLGLFFIGTACFVGPMLFAVAEKCGGKKENKS